MIVWIDTETTGLDPHTGSLLEIAVVVTDDNFNELGAYSTNVLGADLANLDEFIVGMHTKSGLLDELNEGNGQTLEDVKSDLLVWLEQFGDLSRAPLGGSSVHFDRAWLQVHLPTLMPRRSALSLSRLAQRSMPSVARVRLKRLTVRSTIFASQSARLSSTLTV